MAGRRNTPEADLFPVSPDAVSIRLDVLERRLDSLNERLDLLVGGLAELIVLEGGRHRGDREGVIAYRPPGGDQVVGPGTQQIAVCSYDPVTVIVATPNWFTSDKPVAGKKVTFKITASTGATAPTIANNAAGTGAVGPGSSVTVTTNARGEAVVYVHGSATGTIRLNADATWSESTDVVITFV